MFQDCCFCLSFSIHLASSSKTLILTLCCSSSASCQAKRASHNSCCSFNFNFPLILTSTFLVQPFVLALACIIIFVFVLYNCYVIWTLHMQENVLPSLNFIKNVPFNKLKITNLSTNCNSCFYNVHIYSLLLSMH